MIDFTSPNTVAFLQFLGLGFLGIVAAFGHWFGKRRDAPPPSSKDVFIPSLSIADNQVIADATGTLKEANQHMRDRNNLDREMLFHMKLQTEHLEDMKHCLQSLSELLRAPRPKRRS
ncbi:hypothetical protein [Microvirga sp. P5_D2]